VTHRLANLDLLRGMAALLVCAGHLRAFLFVDFGQVTTPSYLDRIFYFFTGLGHQAVVVFFVLSGYLVGGSVLTAYQQGCWSWKSYALRRMSRLWVVLLPALLLTLALDSLGRLWGQSGYEGGWHALYNSGPTPAAPTDLRATTFFGNALFLQTIVVPCFGTNSPLWSLANEFWYYALFPLLCGVWFMLRLPSASQAPSSGIRLLYSALHALLLVALIWCLPAKLVWSGMIWLFGVGAFWAGRFESVRGTCRHPAWLIGAGVLAIGSLSASKTGSIFGTDWGIGIAFALWVIGLASSEHHVGWLKQWGAALSEMSYTLYVVHFPVLAFVFFASFGTTQFQPGMIGYGWFGTLLVGSVAFASAVWWCFERNTDRMRKQIERRLLRRAPEAAAAT